MNINTGSGKDRKFWSGKVLGVLVWRSKLRKEKKTEKMLMIFSPFKEIRNQQKISLKTKRKFSNKLKDKFPLNQPKIPRYASDKWITILLFNKRIYRSNKLRKKCRRKITNINGIDTNKKNVLSLVSQKLWPILTKGTPKRSHRLPAREIFSSSSSTAETTKFVLILVFFSILFFFFYAREQENLYKLLLHKCETHTQRSIRWNVFGAVSNENWKVFRETKKSKNKSNKKALAANNSNSTLIFGCAIFIGNSHVWLAINSRLFLLSSERAFCFNFVFFADEKSFSLSDRNFFGACLLLRVCWLVLALKKNFLDRFQFGLMSQDRLQQVKFIFAFATADFNLIVWEKKFNLRIMRESNEEKKKVLDHLWCDPLIQLFHIKTFCVKCALVLRFDFENSWRAAHATISLLKKETREKFPIIISILFNSAHHHPFDVAKNIIRDS
jgi:hypothetical protein